MNAEMQDKLDQLLTLSLESVITEEQVLYLNQLINSDPEAVKYCNDFLAIASCLHKSKGLINEFILTEIFDEPDAKTPLAEAIERDEKRRIQREAEEARRAAEIKKEEVRKYAEKKFEKFKEEERRRLEKLAYKQYRAERRRLVLTVGSLAACLLLVFGLWIHNKLNKTSAPVVPPVVASISDSVEAQWSHPDIPTDPGAQLIPGYMNLIKGYVKITFDKGAKVILEAPAKIELKDSGHMLLREGRLAARVPAKACGFTIDTPNASMMDIGTEFGVSVEKSGESELHVFRGEVVLFAGKNKKANRTKQSVKTGQAKLVNAVDSRISDISLRKAAYMRHMPSPYELAARKSRPIAYWQAFPRDNSLIDVISKTDVAIQYSSQVKIDEGPYLGEGKVGKSLQLKDKGDYVYIPKFGEMNKGEQVHTYMFWMRADVIKSQDIMINTNKGTTQYRHFVVAEDGRLGHFTYFFNQKKIADAYYSKLRIQPGQWYHIAITRSKTGALRGNVRLFINGTEEASSQIRSTYSPPFYGNIYIGTPPVEGRLAGTGSFEGAIAEFAEYDRVLTPEEIKQMYLTTQR